MFDLNLNCFLRPLPITENFMSIHIVRENFDVYLNS